jgi:hypothetical protein
LAKAAHTAEKIDKTDLFHNALLDFLAAIVALIAKSRRDFWRSMARRSVKNAGLKRLYAAKIRKIHFFSKKLLTNNNFNAKLFIAKIIFLQNNSKGEAL